MSDWEQISSLVHSYARLLDSGDASAVSALFEHSTWRSLPRGSSLRGSDQVRPIYETLMAQEGQRFTKHLITNLSIEVASGSKVASSHCYWTVLQALSGQGITVKLSGQYTDTFEKASDKWRFTDRLITTDFTDVA
jgi:3-phenylpropionate/cinnamic acid dioxygenase small subunit